MRRPPRSPHHARVQDLLAAHLPPPSNKDGMVLVCGPPGMMNAISGDKVCVGGLGKWTSERAHGLLRVW